MSRKFVLPFALVCIAGFSGTAAAQSPDQQRCAGSNPDVTISGCTAMIQSGRETEKSLYGAFFNRGRAYRIKGQFDLAIQDYNQAIRLAPNLANPVLTALAFDERGNAYLSKSQNDLAFQDFDQAIRLSPGYAQAFLDRGIVYGSKHQYDLAVQDFDQAIRIAPNTALAFWNRGMALSNLPGQKDRAMADMNKALQMDPSLAQRLKKN
jgi:tetratricopeptide (TPR) repeat protein